MTQPTEPAKTDMKPSTPVGSSPKPKPAVAARPSDTPPGISPKPKPNVTNSPKPKPAVASKPSNTVGGGQRLAPFEAYIRAGIAGGSSKAMTDEGDMRSKPVAKTRMLDIFPGGTPRLR